MYDAEIHLAFIVFQTANEVAKLKPDPSGTARLTGKFETAARPLPHAALAPRIRGAVRSINCAFPNKRHNVSFVSCLKEPYPLQTVSSYGGGDMSKTSNRAPYIAGSVIIAAFLASVGVWKMIE